MNLTDRVRRVAFTFPVAALAALALILLSEISYQHAVVATRSLDVVTTMRSHVATVLRLMVDAESGQRGYLITGRPSYLGPYEQAVGHIEAPMKMLAEYYAQEPYSLATYQRLSQAVADKLSELSTTVRLRSEGRDEAWRAMMESEIGRERMEDVRELAGTLIAEQEARRLDGLRQVQSTLLLSRVGITMMTLLSLLAFYLYLKQSTDRSRERAEQAAALQTERDRLERQVRSRTQELTALAQHLQTAREDERSHLARELHDELGALLTSAKLDVARLQSRLIAPSPEALQRIAHMNEVLNNGIALKRRIIEDLRPSALSNLGLVPALQILTREFAQRSGLTIDASIDPVELSPSGQLTVYRFVQEALTNIAKYAHARRVEVLVGMHEGQALVRVEDDGRGFDTAAVHGSAHGLLGMRYRVEAEGGQMEVSSDAQGGGTALEARLPRSVQPPASSAAPHPRPGAQAAPLDANPDAIH